MNLLLEKLNYFSLRVHYLFKLGVVTFFACKFQIKLSHKQNEKNIQYGCETYAMSSNSMFNYDSNNNIRHDSVPRSNNKKK